MTGYGLKKIPQDIFKFVIHHQNKLKADRGTNKISFEIVIYKLLREHPAFSEFKEHLEKIKQV